MDGSFFEHSEEERAKKRLLHANRRLQEEKHKEYLGLLQKLELCVEVKKYFTSARKRAKKEEQSSGKEIASLIRRREQLEDAEEKDQARKESLRKKTRSKGVEASAMAQVLKAVEESGNANISAGSEVWEQISKKTCVSVAEMQKEWYSERNKYYDKAPFTPQEDKEIARRKHDWEALCAKIKRAPITLFARYKQLENKQSVSSQWTAEEYELLQRAVEQEGVGNWIKVSAYFSNKTSRQCMQKYIRNVPHFKRGRWTKEEDRALIEAVAKHKKGNWKKIKEHVPGRSGYQCRERYLFTLDPGINFTAWSSEEDRKLVEIMGSARDPDWAGLKAAFPGRSSKQCRARYHNIKKRSVEKIERSEIRVKEDMADEDMTGEDAGNRSENEE